MIHMGLLLYLNDWAKIRYYSTALFALLFPRLLQHLPHLIKLMVFFTVKNDRSIAFHKANGCFCYIAAIAGMRNTDIITSVYNSLAGR